jgi:glycosyltransferase involved in cell wall biosynthesis
VPGLRDSVKNQQTGLLAKDGIIEDLAEKTFKFLTDNLLREKLSLNALEYSKQFSWEKTADEFMKRISNE